MHYASLIVQQWLKNSESIPALDPLNFDEKLPVLHELNRKANTNEIIQLLYRSLPVPDTLDRYSYEESIAAMRDLGIFIGILKKHGIEPVAVIPELEYVLLVLMVKTDLPPRDTLLHYTVWNPDGDRMRTYTGLRDERSLIESVKIAMPQLMEAQRKPRGSRGTASKGSGVIGGIEGDESTAAEAMNPGLKTKDPVAKRDEVPGTGPFRRG